MPQKKKASSTSSFGPGVKSSELSDIRRWLRNKKAGEFDVWFRTRSDILAWREGHRPDAATGLRVVTFFEKHLRHSKGKLKGKPFIPLPWQREGVIIPLFGWLRPDGLRRFRRFFISVAKKQGKSTLFGGFVLYFVKADDEPRAEVYSAASDRGQAKIVFREAAAMVAASPDLRDRMRVLQSTSRIVDYESGSFYAALSGDSGSNEGPDAHAVVLDELHVQKDRRLFDTLAYAGAARSQPMFGAITTAGDDTASIGFEEYTYAKGVLDGTIEDIEFFPRVHEVAMDADWEDEREWPKANPSLGHTIQLDEMRAKYREAKASPNKQNAFRRYRLNQWVEQAERWLDLGMWDACGAQFDDASLLGRECYAGLDLAAVRDTNALALCFPPVADDPFWRFMVRFFIPGDRAEERERRDKIPYRRYAAEGWVMITPGRATDVQYIRKCANEDATRFKLLELPFDRFLALDIERQLREEDGLPTIEYGQGYKSMSGPSKELERLLLEGQMRHNCNPVLRRQANVVAIDTDAAGNIKPSKKRSGDRIDGIVAMIMALGRAMTKNSGRSVYEDRGVLGLDDDEPKDGNPKPDNPEEPVAVVVDEDAQWHDDD